MKTYFSYIEIVTGKGISIHNMNNEILKILTDSGIRNGFLTVTSQHTTTAVTINENESRLLIDVENFFSQLVPAEARYLHNDIHLRECPPDEPENAHAHIVAMLLGSSEAIPLHEGKLMLGQWQSVMLVELDGSRQRKLAIQITGE